MKISLVSIGNEVLQGFTLNTNAPFMAQRLLESGLPVAEQRVVPDAAVGLQQGLREALAAHDVVICTGGLGPTLDDVTRHVVADLVGSPFHYDPEIARDLEERFGSGFPSIRDQATVPSKGAILPNDVGTAPGFRFEFEGRELFLLPGVPVEMEAMFCHYVLPYLIEKYPGQVEHRRIIRLFHTPEVTLDPVLRDLERRYRHLKTGIYPSHGVLGLHLYSERREEVELAAKEVQTEFAKVIFEGASLEEALLDQFIQKGKTLVTAESCTGGSLASHLTRVAGASQYYLGGVVSYSNPIKRDLLGVKEATLNAHGAVSQEVILEMLQGAFDHMGGDFAAAISGIAGPTGGSREKPVGTVWCAVGKRGEAPRAWCLRAKGNRASIITISVYSVLGEIYKQVKRIYAH